ncbi:mediator of RNA polymerase II transcription subunit 21 [Hypoxylon fragiforme]|uniref:mediator of RNA polymerase II transcription subunit 21 n=1 Tax=Hypoxylon fragiforme TaxID=63214 RepID=UPI0020C6BE8D|nr:mediator of RNA polymerase II transcription subunit 21 [Hypoxylon fragiforme]KAI2607524.1 mediator of RNA polymerase II transcription subunit 21 [Hypoxylon fragiforme]
MGDKLTQLQDAIDQLAQQFVASIYYINRHHNLETLGPGDQIRDIKQEPDQQEVDPHPDDVFKASQVELAQDLITKEQQIEYLITLLPGLENSVQDQERNIKELEEELKVAEVQRQEAIKEKEETMAKLDTVIRGIRRP